MPIPSSSIHPSRVYSRTRDRSTILYRHVLNVGRAQWVTSSPVPDSLSNEVWVRYETVIGGLRIVRACTRKAFARWADREETGKDREKFRVPPITFDNKESLCQSVGLGARSL